MKTLLTLFAIAGMTTPALAQGTVAFDNTFLFTTRADRLVRNPAAAGGTPLVGTNFAAQLSYGASPDNLRPLTNAPARFRVPTTSAPGTWSGGMRTLPGFLAGDTLWLQVRVWDYALFPTYEDAVAGGGVCAQSCAFTYTIPGGATPAPHEFWIENFPGMPGPMNCELGWFFWGVSPARDRLVLAHVNVDVWQATNLDQPSWQLITNPATLRIPMTNGAMFFKVQSVSPLLP